MRAPPPARITKEVWQEAKLKLQPHHDSTPLRVDARSWHPAVEQCTIVTHEFKPNKALDVGLWTTDSAKAVFLLPRLPPLWVAWLTRIAQAHPETC